MKTFGQSIAIQTSGPDAVEDFDETLGKARDMLSRNISESLKMLHTLGYAVDVDTVKVTEEQREDTFVLSWTLEARQTVPLWRRLWKAVRA